MTKIKYCGLSRPCDIFTANRLGADYIGFVFAKMSKRCITPAKAAELKQLLREDIRAVGVFVDEEIETVAKLLQTGVIDMAQLHGGEDERYIDRLRRLGGKPVIKAFRVKTPGDVSAAENSSADYVLLDSGAGTGETFDWELLREIHRPYFLAGGLGPGNVEEAVRSLCPYAVDVSSGIETDGVKDVLKMEAFAASVRRAGPAGNPGADDGP